MDDPAAARTVLEATELSRRKTPWRVELRPDRIRGTRGDASFELPRSRLADQLRLADHALARRVLAVRGAQRTTLQFDEDGYRALRAWLGRPLLLRIALGQRLSWTIPIAALFLIASLPLHAAIGSDAVDYDPLRAALGGGLLLQGLLARAWPRRLFFLLDAFVLLAMAVVAVRYVVDGASLLWLPVALLQILLVRTGLRHWHRFSVPEAEETGPGSTKD